MQLVPVAPIPVCDMLVDAYEKEPGNLTAGLLHASVRDQVAGLPVQDQPAGSPRSPALGFNAPSFDNDLKGGIQLKLTAGAGFNTKESNLFRGFTLQMNNVLDLNGNKTDTTTLGEDVSFVFNQEFFLPPTDLDEQRGVPLTRIDVSGYGASAFSTWINEDAQFASTSEARFDIMVGRTAHEVVQVKSIVYPCGIQVVRTITLFRVGSGYVYRFDSGWKAESDGKFDFHFKYCPDPNNPDTDQSRSRRERGALHDPSGRREGSFQCPEHPDRDRRTCCRSSAAWTSRSSTSSSPTLDKPIKYAGGVSPVPVDLQPVYFDADVELENVVQGQVGGRVPAKKILGFVQLAPRGIPLTPARVPGAPGPPVRFHRRTAGLHHGHRQERPEVPHQLHRRQRVRRRRRHDARVRRRGPRQRRPAEGWIVEPGDRTRAGAAR